MISSANRRCDIDGPLGVTLIGFHFLFLIACSIFFDSMFMHRINIYGDIRSPCRISLEGEKKDVLVPLTNMVSLLVVIQGIIRLVIFPRKLKCTTVPADKRPFQFIKSFL